MGLHGGIPQGSRLTHVRDVYLACGLLLGDWVVPWESWTILQGLSGCIIELLRISYEEYTNISNVSRSRNHKCANSNYKYLGIEAEI